MKKYRVLFVLGICLLPFLSGCPEEKTVTTRINRDGSAVRTIGEFDPRSFKGVDSVKHKIPVPVDSSWKMVNITDSTGILVKEFNDVQQLNDLY